MSAPPLKATFRAGDREVAGGENGSEAREGGHSVERLGKEHQGFCSASPPDAFIFRDGLLEASLFYAHPLETQTKATMLTSAVGDFTGQA